MDIQQVANKLRKTIIHHPHFSLSHERLFNLSAIAQPGSVITLVGPTRVGKTFLSHELSENLVSPTAQVKSSCIPIARIEAAATDKGFISTRYLLLQILGAIKHPFYVGDIPDVRMRHTESALRKRAISGFAARKTKYLIIDEAHHLLRTTSDRVAESVLDWVKCFGNETGCITILFGGYALLRFLYLSSHFNGRLAVIEFPNYGDDADDSREFDRLLVTVDEWLPCARGFSLYQFREQINEGCQGCYGQLIHWTLCALAEMQSVGAQRLKLKHFLSTRKVGQVQAIKNDIEAGKVLLTDLAKRMDDHYQDFVPTQPPKQTHRPFQRKPIRDPVDIGRKSRA